MAKPTFTPMKGIVPAARHGIARVEHFTVNPTMALFTSIRAIQHPEELVEAGDYCRLYVDGELMMSDTQEEQRSNLRVVAEARGDVLIAGLGLGMILVPILQKSEVRTVTVVEKYPDVITLVEPAVRRLRGSKKLSIVQADIFEWTAPAGQKWDCIYFDIWPSVRTENLGEMARLHKKFARRKAPGGWMESWKRGWLKAKRDQYRAAGW